MTTKQQLLSLAKSWRDKCRKIDEKFQSANPAQTQIAVSALETCAEEVEELAKGLADE